MQFTNNDTYNGDNINCNIAIATLAIAIATLEIAKIAIAIFAIAVATLVIPIAVAISALAMAIATMEMMNINTCNINSNICSRLGQPHFELPSKSPNLHTKAPSCLITYLSTCLPGIHLT